jgi:quinol monooxygenase YgiN
MAKMILQTTVQDFSKWKSIYDSMDSVRKQFGCTGAEVFRGQENPKAVVVILQWGNLEQAQKYSQSPELKEAFQKAGVLGPPTIDFVK